MSKAMDSMEGPAWAARFLEALKDGNGVRAAAREAGVTGSTPYDRRRKNQAFREAWDAIQPVDGRQAKARTARPIAPRDAQRIEQFLHELAETSNVAAAAAVWRLGGLPRQWAGAAGQAGALLLWGGGGRLLIPPFG